jgi:hypothetical protein
VLTTQQARQLGEAMDWSHATWRGSAAVELRRQGGYDAMALELVRTLRRRSEPDMGYDDGYIAWVRAAASPAHRDAARRKISEQLQWGPGTIRHYGLSLPPEMLIAHAKADDFNRFAQQILEHQPQWSACTWGTAQMLMRFLQIAWKLDTCPDEAVAAALLMLAQRVELEWRSSRQWSETMLSARGHNWWLCQFSGLWKAAVLLPELRAGQAFAALGESYLPQELQRLFTREGWAREGSMMYHALAAAVVQDWARVARRVGRPAPRPVREALAAMARLEAALLTPDGSLPALGDCSETFPPGWMARRLRHWALVSADRDAAALAHACEPDTGPDDTLHDSDDVASGEFLFTTVGQRVPRPGAGADLPPLDHALADSGLYVMRDRWQRDANYMLIDAMPKGELITSHGHDGLLHLLIHACGTPVIVDVSGGWQYDASPDLQRVRARAHNVATLNSEGHCGIAGPFRFQTQLTPWVERWLSTDKACYFSAAHEGPRALNLGYSTLRRKVLFVRGRYWIVLDRLDGRSEQPQQFAQHWHLGLPWRKVGPRSLHTLGPEGNLWLEAAALPGDDLCMTVEPLAHPMAGLPNPDRLTFSRAVSSSAVLATVLAPYQGSPPQVRIEAIPLHADGRELAGHEATALRIEIDGRSDTFVDWHMPWVLPWRAGDCRGQARLFHSSCDLA